MFWTHQAVPRIRGKKSFSLFRYAMNRDMQADEGTTDRLACPRCAQTPPKQSSQCNCLRVDWSTSRRHLFDVLEYRHGVFSDTR